MSAGIEWDGVITKGNHIVCMPDTYQYVHRTAEIIIMI